MVVFQNAWGFLPAAYLFLGGMSAGAFLTVCVLRLAYPKRHKNTLNKCTWIALALMALGLIALIAETDKPLQAINLFASFTNFGSWMAIGAWVLLATFVIMLLAALASTGKVAFLKDEGMLTKVLAILGIPFSLAVAVYTGILLMSAPAIDFWHSALLPLVFTASALDTGVALVACMLCFGESEDADLASLIGKLEGMIMMLVVIEVCFLAVLLSTQATASTASAASVAALTQGELSAAFWGLVMACGLLVPLAAAILQSAGGHKFTRALTITGAAGSWIGGLALRVLILTAGCTTAMLSPDAAQAIQGIILAL